MKGKMGMHKHAISGRNRTHPAVAADMAREVNAKQKKAKPNMTEDIKQLFSGARNK